MWFIRRMQRIPYTAKMTNENVLKRCGTKRILLKNIRIRKTKFFRHIIRTEGLEHLATTGRLEGKRSRGRQREKIITGIGKWLKIENLIHRAYERDDWRSLIVYAFEHDTE